MKNNIKIIASILITMIISISGTAFAENLLYNASEVSFTASKSNQEKGFDATTVDGALNQIYGKLRKPNSSVFTNWKTASNWNTNTLISNPIINENDFIYDSSNKIVTVTESGNYEIYLFCESTGAQTNTPQFKIYINDTLFQSGSCSKTADGKVNKKYEVTLTKDDQLYGQMYGGSNYPTYFITIFKKFN